MNMLISVIVGGLVLGCTYGMLSLGYSLIYQASGYMNFTQATLLMFGSFLAWQFLGMGNPIYCRPVPGCCHYVLYWLDDGTFCYPDTG